MIQFLEKYTKKKQFKKMIQEERLKNGYVKGKLYLRTQSMDVGSIAIINPENFEKETDVTLHCPEMFSHPTL